MVCGNNSVSCEFVEKRENRGKELKVLTIPDDVFIQIQMANRVPPRQSVVFEWGLRLGEVKSR